MKLTKIQSDVISEFSFANDSISTWGIAHRIGLPTSKTLRIVKGLESLGLVEKCQRYSSKNNYVWKLADK